MSEDSRIVVARLDERMSNFIKEQEKIRTEDIEERKERREYTDHIHQRIFDKLEAMPCHTNSEKIAGMGRSINRLWVAISTLFTGFLAAVGMIMKGSSQ